MAGWPRHRDRAQRGRSRKPAPAGGYCRAGRRPAGTVPLFVAGVDGRADWRLRRDPAPEATGATTGASRFSSTLIGKHTTRIDCQKSGNARGRRHTHTPTSTGGPSATVSYGHKKSPAVRGFPQCAREDSNLHGPFSPQGPQPRRPGVRLARCCDLRADRLPGGTYRTHLFTRLLPKTCQTTGQARLGLHAAEVTSAGASSAGENIAAMIVAGTSRSWVKG